MSEFDDLSMRLKDSKESFEKYQCLVRQEIERNDLPPNEKKDLIKLLENLETMTHKKMDIVVDTLKEVDKLKNESSSNKYLKSPEFSQEMEEIKKKASKLGEKIGDINKRLFPK
ncbi:uncharacterized protein [Rhodnius prolixus]|uniref:Uncharacterized protein n=1 Tax=Rhodnius prolixus TaxID=13249 RepID=T1HQY1_RHOPR